MIIFKLSDMLLIIFNLWLAIAFDSQPNLFLAILVSFLIIVIKPIKIRGINEKKK